MRSSLEQHVTDPPDSQKNYLVVDSKTETSTIEGAFDSFTRDRKDIAVVLINQHVRPPQCSLKKSDVVVRLHELGKINTEQSC